MKVLFVCSGNNAISPIIKAQAESLEKAGIDVELLPIVGKGLLGYLKFIPQLRVCILKAKPDIVHAHYSFCGIVASFSTGKPVITSLMGSDVNQSGLLRLIIRFFVKYVWVKTIVKSKDMKSKIGVHNVIVLPNGVNLDVFKPMDKIECRKKLGWDLSKKLILFAADPKRHEKNFSLAKESISNLNDSDILLICKYGMEHNEVPYCLNACDVLLLTSKWEGSPNIVKEAMACNTPIIATDVGDVRFLLGGVDKCHIVPFSKYEIGEKIDVVLLTPNKCNAREAIIKKGLDSLTISHKLAHIYKEVSGNV